LFEKEGRSLIYDGELLYDVIFLGEVERLNSDYVDKYILTDKIWNIKTKIASIYDEGLWNNFL